MYIAIREWPDALSLAFLEGNAKGNAKADLFRLVAAEKTREANARPHGLDTHRSRGGCSAYFGA